MQEDTVGERTAVRLLLPHPVTLEPRAAPGSKRGPRRRRECVHESPRGSERDSSQSGEEGETQCVRPLPPRSEQRFQLSRPPSQEGGRRPWPCRTPVAGACAQTAQGAIAALWCPPGPSPHLPASCEASSQLSEGKLRLHGHSPRVASLEEAASADARRNLASPASLPPSLPRGSARCRLSHVGTVLTTA